jgi:hypothetical protein
MGSIPSATKKKKKKKTQKTEKKELAKMPFESCVDNGMMEYFNP